MIRNFLTFALILSSILGNAQVTEEGELLMKSIYFGGGRYGVSPDQKEELINFIEEFEDLGNYEIVIFSHTDNIGGKEYNEWLSKMRSTTVFNVILNIPIPEEKIKIRDFGMENPLYNNTNHLGRRANRRVDVILMPIVF